jgi:hypothetical protein
LMIAAAVLTLAPEPWSAVGVAALIAVAWRMGRVRL